MNENNIGAANDKLIDQFFDEYASRVNAVLNGEEANVQAQADAFAEFFVESSPVGVMGGKNDASFREKIPEGYRFYKSIGTKSMNIAFKQITPIDTHHSMVKLGWRMIAVNKKVNDVEINFDVFYLLRIYQDQIKIFAYIAGDEQKELKDHGLV